MRRLIIILGVFLILVQISHVLSKDNIDYINTNLVSFVKSKDRPVGYLSQELDIYHPDNDENITEINGYDDISEFSIYAESHNVSVSLDFGFNFANIYNFSNKMLIFNYTSIIQPYKGKDVYLELTKDYPLSNNKKYNIKLKGYLVYYGGKNDTSKGFMGISYTSLLSTRPKRHTLIGMSTKVFYVNSGYLDIYNFGNEVFMDQYVRLFMLGVPPENILQEFINNVTKIPLNDKITLVPFNYSMILDKPSKLNIEFSWRIDNNDDKNNDILSIVFSDIEISDGEISNIVLKI